MKSSSSRRRSRKRRRTDRKSYMGCPNTQIDLTLNDLEGSKPSSLRLGTRVPCKGAELGHMLQ